MSYQENLKQFKMIEIINMFLLAGDKFMPEMHLKLEGHLLKTKKEFKNSRKQDTLSTSTGTN